VSTVFYPGAYPNSSDLILESLDSVFFYVHVHILLKHGDSIFSSLLSTPLGASKKDRIVHIPETSAILDVILHFLYGESCARQLPSLDIMANAIYRMPIYGIEPKSQVIPSNPSYSYLLSLAPIYPLELYILAARLDLFDLAQSTSSHLLSLPLSTIDEDTAGRIGAVYLKRLFILRLYRSNKLKSILLQPPYPHPSTAKCTFQVQKDVSRLWALGAAQLVWHTMSDVSPQHIESVFRLLQESIGCALCQTAFSDRLKDVITRWAFVERTISR